MNSEPVNQSAESACPENQVPAEGRLNARWAVPGVCLFLAAIVLLVFGRTLRCGFVNFDDDTNVYENSHVTDGLSVPGITRAFVRTQIGHWDPLTTISHLLDCQLYGLHPWGHHLTNVLLHGTSAILLFLLLKRLTRSFWCSAFAAALWAIHPLRVESVAWISERKDVLSGVFFMLTLLAYESYVRKGRELWRYLLVMALFACGLMSKSMLVTLPVVLLLLDWWPLERFGKPADWRRAAPLIREKLPMFALSGLMAVVQVLSAHGTIVALDKLPFSQRLANAFISYIVYIREIFWPFNLAVFYPYPNRLPLWEAALALAALIAITGGCYLLRRKCPWLLMGWLWYVVMLVPVIGIVQAGELARADRYTYLPQIGLCVMLAWIGAALTAKLHLPRWAPGMLSIGAIVALMTVAFHQISYWDDSETLWSHALACTDNNRIAHNNLGNVLAEKGELDQALAHFQAALKIKPDFAEAFNNVGDILLDKGDFDEAIAVYRRALAIKPDYAEAHYNLGDALSKKGDVDGAIAQFRMALAITPDAGAVHYNLGNAYLRKGMLDDAFAEYQKVLQTNPRFAEVYNNIANILVREGRSDEAVGQYETALKLKPNYPEARYNLANILIGKGELNEAIAQLQAAVDNEPDFVDAQYVLAVTLRRTGRINEAIVHYRKVLEIKPDSVETENNLAYLLAACGDSQLRNGAEAEELAKRANQQTGGSSPIILGTLAAAYAEEGRFPEALTTVNQAIQAAEAHGNNALASSLQEHLKLYEAGKPLREN
jgi:tetratricopeptide (TPR) repeat protein